VGVWQGQNPLSLARNSITSRYVALRGQALPTGDGKGSANRCRIHTCSFCCIPTAPHKKGRGNRSGPKPVARAGGTGPSGWTRRGGRAPARSLPGRVVRPSDGTLRQLPVKQAGNGNFCVWRERAWGGKGRRWRACGEDTRREKFHFRRDGRFGRPVRWKCERASGRRFSALSNPGLALLFRPGNRRRVVSRECWTSSGSFGCILCLEIQKGAGMETDRASQPQQSTGGAWKATNRTRDGGEEPLHFLAVVRGGGPRVYVAACFHSTSQVGLRASIPAQHGSVSPISEWSVAALLSDEVPEISSDLFHALKRRKGWRTTPTSLANWMAEEGSGENRLRSRNRAKSGRSRKI